MQNTFSASPRNLQEYREAVISNKQSNIEAASKAYIAARDEGESRLKLQRDHEALSVALEGSLRKIWPNAMAKEVDYIESLAAYREAQGKLHAYRKAVVSRSPQIAKAKAAWEKSLKSARDFHFRAGSRSQARLHEVYVSLRTSDREAEFCNSPGLFLLLDQGP